jgi:hypothetical protein
MSTTGSAVETAFPARQVWKQSLRFSEALNCRVAVALHARQGRRTNAIVVDCVDRGCRMTRSTPDVLRGGGSSNSSKRWRLPDPQLQNNDYWFMRWSYKPAYPKPLPSPGANRR